MRRSKAPSAMAAKQGGVSSPPPQPVKREPLSNVSNAPPTTTTATDPVHKVVDTTTKDTTSSEPAPATAKPSKFKAPFKSPTTSTSVAIAKVKQQQEKKVSEGNAEPDLYFTVMWCNYSTKKHKSYNDGSHPLQIYANT